MFSLVDALDAESGTTCLVGAGGKKTTLYALAKRFDRAVVTATVRIPIFDRAVAELRVTEDPATALSGASFPLGLVPERDRSDRYRGYDPEMIDELADAHDGPVLVKADGARTRELKAPNDREPRIPAGTDVVVPVASVQSVGCALTEEIVHRPERVARLTGLDVGGEITAEAVGTVVAHEDGGLRGVPQGATPIPLLNKVDDADDESTAREIADVIHDRTDVPKVVLARMATGEIVDVISATDAG